MDIFCYFCNNNKIALNIAKKSGIKLQNRVEPDFKFSEKWIPTNYPIILFTVKK